MSVLLVTRVPKNLILLPIEIVLVYFGMKLVNRIYGALPNGKAAAENSWVRAERNLSPPDNSPPALSLDKTGGYAIIKPKGHCYSSQALVLSSVKFWWPFRVPAGRSSRFYTENVQYNDRTYKKLKCFLLHLCHLLPAADCGKGKEGLTALCNSVRNDYSI